MEEPRTRPSLGDPPARAHPEPVPLVSPSDLINPMLKVADVVTSAPRTCSPASTVLEAVLIFRDADCGIVPVTDGGRVAGVLTDRDVALALADHEADLAGTPVGELMATDVATIEADATLDVAIERLGGHGVRRLMAVDSDGQLVGILGWTDLIPHVSERAIGQVVSRIVEHR